MAVDVIDSAADSGSMEDAIAQWRAETSPTSVEDIDVTLKGSNRALITIRYT